MKRVSLLLLLLVGCHAASTPPPPPPPTIYGGSFTWLNSNPVCSATVQTSCAASVVVTDLTVGTILAGVTLANLSGFVTSTPQKQGITHVYQFVFNGFDENGNQITSPPETFTLNIP